MMANDNFTKPFKTYLEEVAIYNFINNIIRELVMTKECNEDFKNSTKCQMCDNDYVNNDAKFRDPCHTTGIYRGSAHRDCKL